MRLFKVEYTDLTPQCKVMKVVNSKRDEEYLDGYNFIEKVVTYSGVQELQELQENLAIMDLVVRNYKDHQDLDDEEIERLNIIIDVKGSKKPAWIK